MNRKEFVEQTVLSLDEKFFYRLKDHLADEYIPFAFVIKKDINQMIFAEKLCDYFEKIRLKTGKSFRQIIEKYVSDLDYLIFDRIAKESKTKKNENVKKTPRARKYFERACFLKKHRKLTEQNLLDYSRIMLCLYMAIINNNFKPIDDFDFSVSCLDANNIIKAMQKEKYFFGKKQVFDTDDIYSLDRSTFVILIVILYYIKNKEIIGEY